MSAAERPPASVEARFDRRRGVSVPTRGNALRLLRLLMDAGVEPGVVRDYEMTAADAELVVALAALFHDVGMSIHREHHETYSLFVAQPVLRRLLAEVYEPGEATIERGESAAVRIRVEMTNSAGVFQLDQLLRKKLRGSGLERDVEVEATMRGEEEAEKRLVERFRL